MVPPKEPRDRDDRPSWSEIDKMRDRSAHRKEKTEERRSDPKQQSFVKTQALKHAKGVFDKKLSADAQNKLDAIYSAKGGAALAGAVKEYIDGYGLPDDWRTLLFILDLPDETVFSQAVEKLQGLAPQQPMASRTAFKSKLSILSLTSGNSEIRRIATQVKAKL